ncbi:MAG: hypothetical protein ACR2GO_01605, partial [Candidatus Limnocylindria bacterium]
MTRHNDTLETHGARIHNEVAAAVSRLPSSTRAWPTCVWDDLTPDRGDGPAHARGDLRDGLEVLVADGAQQLLQANVDLRRIRRIEDVKNTVADVVECEVVAVDQGRLLDMGIQLELRQPQVEAAVRSASRSATRAVPGAATPAASTSPLASTTWTSTSSDPPSGT